MINNLGNRIFLFLSLDKFTIVALNSTDDYIYKRESSTNNKSNQIDFKFL